MKKIDVSNQSTSIWTVYGLLKLFLWALDFLRMLSSLLGSEPILSGAIGHYYDHRWKQIDTQLWGGWGGEGQKLYTNMPTFFDQPVLMYNVTHCRQCVFLINPSGISLLVFSSSLSYTCLWIPRCRVVSWLRSRSAGTSDSSPWCCGCQECPCPTASSWAACPLMSLLSPRCVRSLEVQPINCILKCRLKYLSNKPSLV